MGTVEHHAKFTFLIKVIYSLAGYDFMYHQLSFHRNTDEEKAKLQKLVSEAQNVTRVTIKLSTM